MQRTTPLLFIGLGGPQFFGNFVNNKSAKDSGKATPSGVSYGFSLGTFGGGSPGGFVGNLFGGTGSSNDANSSFGGSFGGLFDKALEWCSESHARGIAQRQGIDIRNISFIKTPEGGIKAVVDAPNATPKQIEQLGEQVMQECPVARFRKAHVKSSRERMQWERLPDPYDR